MNNWKSTTFHFLCGYFLCIQKYHLKLYDRCLFVLNPEFVVRLTIANPFLTFMHKVTFADQYKIIVRTNTQHITFSLRPTLKSRAEYNYKQIMI